MMDRSFRRQTLRKLASYGPITQAVSTGLAAGSAGPKETKYDEATFNISGGTIYIPANAVKPDGTYNVIIAFKSGIGHIAKGGMNAVIVTANEAPGNQFTGDFGKRYGAQQPRFISEALGAVQNYLKKKNPNAKLGKYAISAFSGGSGAITGGGTSQGLQLPPEANNNFAGFVMVDSLHEPQTLLDWAKKNNITGDPSKKLAIIHSMIRPPQGASTSAVGQKFVDEFGLSRQEPTNWDSSIPAPISVASKGGLSVIQMPGTDAEAHRKLMRGEGQLMSYIFPDW